MQKLRPIFLLVFVVICPVHLLIVANNHIFARPPLDGVAVRVHSRLWVRGQDPPPFPKLRVRGQPTRGLPAGSASLRFGNKRLPFLAARDFLLDQRHVWSVSLGVGEIFTVLKCAKSANWLFGYFPQKILMCAKYLQRNLNLRDLLEISYKNVQKAARRGANSIHFVCNPLAATHQPLYCPIIPFSWVKFGSGRGGRMLRRGERRKRFEV